MTSNHEEYISDITLEKKIFFLIGIHSMQGWTSTTRHGVTRNKAQKRLQDTGNLFRKNLQLKCLVQIYWSCIYVSLQKKKWRSLVWGN